ncbi:DUF5518 domain-containing protein [Natronorubrum daqingense]|uniref:DUF5518 domain-containing protein n=1 Tax=Natronorubrum daqingense TaxID=588898 RepID=UPI0011158C7C|nr:DUF5518 domain-containing protein [Natronorubrum daqingense]
MGIHEKATRLWNDESWRYPLIVGGISVPILISLQTMTDGSFTSLLPLLAGFLVGFWPSKNNVSSKRVGWRAGLVSGFALVYQGAIFSTLIPYDAQPLFASIFTLVALVFVVALAVVVYGVIGAIGGMIGDWLFENTKLRPGSLSA